MSRAALLGQGRRGLKKLKKSASDSAKKGGEDKKWKRTNLNGCWNGEMECKHERWCGGIFDERKILKSVSDGT